MAQAKPTWAEQWIAVAGPQEEPEQRDEGQPDPRKAEHLRLGRLVLTQLWNELTGIELARSLRSSTRGRLGSSRGGPAVWGEPYLDWDLETDGAGVRVLLCRGVLGEARFMWRTRRRRVEGANQWEPWAALLDLPALAARIHAATLRALEQQT